MVSSVIEHLKSWQDKFEKYFPTVSIENQCRRQSKQSEGAPAENGGALKKTEVLHIKTDTLQLQIMRYFKNFVIMFEKRDV